MRFGTWLLIALLPAATREVYGQSRSLTGWVETWQGKRLGGGIEILIPGTNAVFTKAGGDFQLPLPDDVTPGDEIVLLIRDKSTDWKILHPFEGRTVVPKPKIPVRLRVARKGDRVIASDTAIVRQFLADAIVKHPTIGIAAILDRFATVMDVPGEVLQRTVEIIYKTSPDTLSRALAALFSKDYINAYRLISGFAAVSDVDEYTQFYTIGTSKYLEGNFDAAANAFTRAKELRPNDPWVQTSLASAYFARGEYQSADSAFTILLSAGDSTPHGGPVKWYVPAKYNVLPRAWAEREYGLYLVSVGRFTEGVNRLSSALDSINKAVGPNNPAAMSTAVRLAVARANAGEWQAADSALRAALTLSVDTTSTEHVSLLIAAGEVAVRVGRVAEGEAAVRRGLALREAAFGPSHPSVAQALVALGNVLRLRGDAAGADLVFRRALTLQEILLGGSHPEVMRTLRALAQTERTLGNTSEAVKFEGRLRAFPRDKLASLVLIDQPQIAIPWN